MECDNITRDCDDQGRQAQERLETLLLAGLDSGDPIEVNEAYWQDKKRRLEERRKKAKLAGTLT